MALEIGFASDLEICQKEIMDFYSKHWVRPIAQVINHSINGSLKRPLTIMAKTAA